MSNELDDEEYQLSGQSKLPFGRFLGLKAFLCGIAWK